jgi:putative peptidoglycan binding protein
VILAASKKVSLVTTWAVVLTCACALAAARQSSSSDSATKKPASPSVKTVSSTKSKTHTGKRSRKKRVRGQQKIDSERAQAIQEALIREHYLKGEATGTWNQASEEAMRRYQADNGWQSKTVPDSRALIKLGLGPSKDHLLNPESAMTTVPDAPRAEPVPTTSQSASPTTSHSATPTSDSAPAPNSHQSDVSRPQ